MPKKKASKPKRRKASKEVRAEIEKMVDGLPELLSDTQEEPWNPETHDWDNDPEEPHGKKRDSYYSHHDSDDILSSKDIKRAWGDQAHHHHRKRQMVIWGVVAIAVMIFAVWTVNARIVIHDIANAPTPSTEGQLLNTAKNDFSAIIDTISSQEEAKIRANSQIREAEKEVQEEQTMKERLGALFTALKNVNTASSTIDTLPSSTSTATTTSSPQQVE